MRKKWMSWLSWVTASGMVAALGAACLAQDAPAVRLANNDSDPLQIVSVSPRLSDDLTKFEGAKVTVQNTGSVPCVAFGVSLVLTFSNSEERTTKLSVDLVSLGYAKPGSASNRIAPKQVYTETMHVRTAARESSATITGIEARVDYVEMADGKKYGEDPGRLGEIFRMSRWGHAAERKRLLDIYDSSGLQALLDELKREQ